MILIVNVLNKAGNNMSTNTENKNWPKHAEFVVLFITLLGGFYLIDSKIDRQSSRTDKLYEMFIDLIKEGRK